MLKRLFFLKEIGFFGQMWFCWVTLGDLGGSETVISCFHEDKGGVVVIGE